MAFAKLVKNLRGRFNVKHTKSKLPDAVKHYEAMYEATKNWNVVSFNKETKDHYIFDLGCIVGEAPYHGLTSREVRNENYHYSEVVKAYKALKIALQQATGIEV